MTELDIKEVQGPCQFGGQCANCGEDKHAQHRSKVIAGYYDETGYIVEPFNLCDQCLAQFRNNSHA